MPETQNGSSTLVRTFARSNPALAAENYVAPCLSDPAQQSTFGHVGTYGLLRTEV
jgi:hypothetical protein